MVKPALAHPGHEETASFMQGVVHPISGLDHLLAIILVGLFAVQIGGRGLWLLPATFVSAMAIGSLAGIGGVAPSFVETAIALSVIALGVVVALQLRLPLTAAGVFTGVIALIHGHAHGSEAAGGISFSYVAGFLVSTAAALAIGIGAGLAITTSTRRPVAARWAGGIGAGAGILLLGIS